MIIEDFVMLGKTVPESNKDGRMFVCTAGYSLKLNQAVRIYPMARRKCPSRWAQCCIPVERNFDDSRTESFKINGDRRPRFHDHINDVIQIVAKKVPPSTQYEILRAMTVPSLKEANDRRLSLCVIKPEKIPTIHFKEGEEAMAPTPDLLGDVRDLPVSQRFRWHPRLKFYDAEGKKHDLMLRDWGCYELMRKRGDNYALCSLSEALNLSTAPPLLCGNLNQFRNSWLIISVLQGTIHARPEVSERQFALNL